MRIALFIGSSKKNTGFGGHYRSLLSYYSELAKSGNVVKLLHYSKLSKSILDDKIKNELEGVKDSLSFLKNFRSVIKDVDAIISFTDSFQSNMLRLWCWKNGKRFIQVIAGGKSRRVPFFFSNSIYFSEENLSSKIDLSINKILITNRVNDFECDDTLIKDLKTEYPRKSLNVLRVSRIGLKYYNSILSAVKFHKFLISKGFDVQTHIIGIVENENSYQDLLKEVEGMEDIYIIVDDKYTKDVKLLLDYYDITVGIGRSFWEAVSRNLIVLGFSSSCELPVVINEATYEIIRAYNFSPRTNIDSSFSIENNLPTLMDANVAATYKKFLHDKYLQDYSSSTLASKITDVINRARKEQLHMIFASSMSIIFSNVYHVFKRDYESS